MSWQKTEALVEEGDLVEFGGRRGGIGALRFWKMLLEWHSCPSHCSEFRQERMPMRPSVALDMKRIAVREAVGRFRTANLRVFGSVLHGTDRDGSDIDLLVDALPGATLLDLGDLEDELKSLLGVDVDLLTPEDLPPMFRDKVLAEALPV
jgi:predicted nucleotidyltransferase